MPEDT